MLAKLSEAEGAAEGEMQELGAGLVGEDGFVAAVGGADGLGGGVGGDDGPVELAELDAGLEGIDDGAVVAGGEVEEIAELMKPSTPSYVSGTSTMTSARAVPSSALTTSMRRPAAFCLTASAWSLRVGLVRSFSFEAGDWSRSLKMRSVSPVLVV